MYTRFFGLNEKPFAITPNPRYLYMSERHAEALAHLMYGLNEAGGFIQLTGEVGTGKTTVIRTLLEQLPQHADVALILNPALTPIEFLFAICQELHIAINAPEPHGSKQLIDALNAHLLDKHAKGRRVVVIVDEAQNLAPDTLEQVRMLTNLETSTHKLLQIILIGQPELREVLARSELRQLAQRITGRYHLAPLSREDTAAYVRHRMKVAGAREDVFSESALREIHRRSKGIPRVINIICDRALLGAYALEQYDVTARLIRDASNEVAGHWRTYEFWPWLKLIAAAALLGTITLGVLSWSSSKPVAPVVVVNPLVKAEPAKPIVVDINSLFKEIADTAGTDNALSTLFDLWHVKLDPNAGAACEQAPVSGLECVYQKGVWAQLVALNRPAILQLNDDAGTVHQIVMTGLKEGNAQIMINGHVRNVTVASIARYWNGDYLIVWRPQLTNRKTLSFGMHSKDVEWVRSALSATQISAASSADSVNEAVASKSKSYFDESLMKQVIDFQRTHHLNADGVVGVQTQIALDALLNHDHGPLLLATPNS